MAARICISQTTISTPIVEMYFAKTAPGFDRSQRQNHAHIFLSQVVLPIPADRRIGELHFTHSSLTQRAIESTTCNRPDREGIVASSPRGRRAVHRRRYRATEDGDRRRRRRDN